MICVSISEPDLNACKSLLEDLEMAEIRLDMCNFDSEQIEEVFSMPVKLVATHRPTNLPDSERLELLKLAIKFGADYVDIEIESKPSYRKELIEYARQHGCLVILSYHNFEETPPVEELNRMMEEMYIYGADVAKIATMVNHPTDNAKLLSLYQRDGRIIAIGMGDKGKITRVVGPLLDAEFTFAALNEGKSTAPGQLTFNHVQKVLNELQNL